MQTGLHAIGWGLQRLGIVLGVIVFGTLLAYAILVTIIVVGQGVAAFGQ
jgi:hypothetical protein